MGYVISNLSTSEQDYIKAIYSLSAKREFSEYVNTNAIALELQNKAASVTDMVKKLAEKGLLIYQAYNGVKLSNAGIIEAKMLIRKHRLWEYFLVEKLAFTWDEVHPIAEQLEHIQSDELIDKLDVFLGQPRFDPHGDPIPDKSGQVPVQSQVSINQLKVGQQAIVVGVNLHTAEFLRFLNELTIKLGTNIVVNQIYDFDETVELLIDNVTTITLSSKVSKNIIVKNIDSN